MKLLLLNHIQNARDSLRANRMRTILTITGVTIGIMSIVAILALAGGANSIVKQQVDNLGGNLAVIRPGSPTSHTFTSIANQQAHETYSTSTLSERDIARIKTLPHISAVAPLIIIPGTIQGTNTAPSAAVTVASDASLLQMSGVELQDGEFTTTDQKLVTIGRQLSIDLFGTEDSLGKTVTIRGQQFRVGGILKNHDTPVNFNGINFNETALIPQAQARELLQPFQVQQINVQVDSIGNLNQAVIAINKSLLDSHNNEQDFSVLTGNAISEPTSQLFFAIAGVTAAIAGISLLVGGIGIMNIMLVNVAERTREIGLRKALGATRADIVWQFLIESVIMGFIGGVIGIIAGIGLAFGISLYLTFDPIVTWQMPLIALGISAATGLVFGLYPAYRASGKDPIESLRNSH
jgi:ABC-type antimicrobial peptide transport system permease subunit